MASSFCYLISPLSLILSLLLFSPLISLLLRWSSWSICRLTQLWREQRELSKTPSLAKHSKQRKAHPTCFLSWYVHLNVFMYQYTYLISAQVFLVQPPFNFILFSTCQNSLTYLFYFLTFKLIEPHFDLLYSIQFCFFLYFILSYDFTVFMYNLFRLGGGQWQALFGRNWEHLA